MRQRHGLERVERAFRAALYANQRDAYYGARRNNNPSTNQQFRPHDLRRTLDTYPGSTTNEPRNQQDPRQHSSIPRGFYRVELHDPVVRPASLGKTGPRTPTLFPLSLMILPVYTLSLDGKRYTH